MINSNYDSEGTAIKPAIPIPADQITLMYNGLLFKNGAKEVYAHACFNFDWLDAKDYLMNPLPTGFEVALTPPPDANTLSVCFKDSADHWDNNSGINYTFKIENTTLETLQQVSTSLGAMALQAKDVQERQMFQSLIQEVGWISTAYQQTVQSNLTSGVV